MEFFSKNVGENNYNIKVYKFLKTFFVVTHYYRLKKKRAWRDDTREA